MIQRRYTIGKKFRTMKQMRKKDPKAIIPEMPELLKEYVQHLQSLGVTINKLRFAIFETKNGLKYPGLIATDQIIANETLVQVPMHLLLTTRHAFESPIQRMFLEHPQFYSNLFTSSWEDHMLLSYLLFEYQRGKESEWYYLIQNLPKEIDYLVFWDRKEQELLDDPVLVKQAQKQYAEFVIEFEVFSRIAAKYPNLYKEGTVTYENVKWIYTHLVTRCFGKYLAYVTMVPFCELFNHECIDVYYDFEYNNDNPSKSEESEECIPVKLTPDEELSQTSSEGSYNSDDEVSDSEFLEPQQLEEEFDFDKYVELEKGKFFDQFSQTFNVEHLPEEEEETYNNRIRNLQDQQIKMRKEFNIKLNLQREIFLLAKDIKQWMYSNLDFGDAFSLFFIGQMYPKLMKSMKEYILGTKAYFMAREDMKRIQLTCNNFKTQLYAFMKDVMKRQIYSTSNFAQKRERIPEQTMSAEQILEQSIDYETEYFKTEWEKDKFDRFVMKCSRKDQFEPGSQVYFCYGRLSNRMMLMRYGMALEHNKYDHYHLRVEYLKYMKSNEAINLAYKYKLSKLKRFKLRFTSFPMDLVVFCKATLWTFNVHSLETFFAIQDLELERQGLLLAYEILSEQQGKFVGSVESNEQQLYDKQLGYHEHFATIYRLERERIVSFNIHLIQICLRVVERMLEGIEFGVAVLRVHDLESQNECNTNRIILKRYFDNMKFALYIRK